MRSRPLALRTTSLISSTSAALILLLLCLGGCRGTAPAADRSADGPGGDGAIASPDGLAAADGKSAPDTGPTCAKGTVKGGLPATNGITVVVEAASAGHALSPVLQGANINQWYQHANGLWDAGADAPTADAVAKAARAGLGLLRFPGGTCANLFDWKRSVGPRAQRGCQTDAGDALVARNEKEYGASEFIRLVRSIGAEPQIMVPFANESPEDAADWVEYMNAPAGTNPNGGVAWADVRKADGSAAPYGVTRWEIGNEHDRGGHQAYWMTTGAGLDSQRLDEYIDGAEREFVNQPMGRGCDFTQTTTTGSPGQTFHFLYGLIKKGTFPTVKVGGTVWTRTDDLATAGGGAQVYQLDRGDGSIRFGDGAHGAIPPSGQTVTASYTFRHQGFVAIHDAMKAVAAQTGTPISICATWAPPAPRGTPASVLGQPRFSAAMKSRGYGTRYDCISMHPYTNFGRDFGAAWTTPEEGHHEHMLGEAWSREMVGDLSDDLQASAPGAYVAVSEMGALWFSGNSSDGAALPQSSATMTHALFMASQWISFARLRLGWVEGNTLVADELRGVLGGKGTGFVYSAEAMTREALKPFFAKGSIWVASRVDSKELVTAPGGETYAALVVGASRGPEGALRIVVVNRRRAEKQTARVAPAGFTRGAEVEVTTVRGASFMSYNDEVPGGGDDTVKITRTTEALATSDFDFTFPPASVTILTLRPPCP